MDVDLSPLVVLQKGLQPAGMVVVAVGEHSHVHLFQVHPQRGGVGKQQLPAGTEVKQDVVFFRLQIKAQPVGPLHLGLHGLVLHQNSQFHADSSQNVIFWHYHTTRHGKCKEKCTPLRYNLFCFFQSDVIYY